MGHKPERKTEPWFFFFSKWSRLQGKTICHTPLPTAQIKLYSIFHHSALSPPPGLGSTHLQLSRLLYRSGFFCFGRYVVLEAVALWYFCLKLWFKILKQNVQQGHGKVLGQRVNINTVLSQKVIPCLFCVFLQECCWWEQKAVRHLWYKVRIMPWLIFLDDIIKRKMC